MTDVLSRYMRSDVCSRFKPSTTPYCVIIMVAHHSRQCKNSRSNNQSQVIYLYYKQFALYFTIIDGRYQKQQLNAKKQVMKAIDYKK